MAPATMLNSYQRTRLLLFYAVALSIGATMTIVWLTGVPALGQLSATLLAQPWALMTLVVTLLCIGLCAAIGWLVAGTVRYDTPVMCSAVGLFVIAANLGPTRMALVNEPSARVYVQLAIELVILGAFLGAVSVVQSLLAANDLLKIDRRRDGLIDAEPSIPMGFAALGMHAAVSVVMVMIFARSDDMLQTMAAVGIAGFAASVAVQWSLNVAPAIWYWPGVMIAGLAGYLWAAGAPGMIAIGLIDQPLARPAPLHYASVGVFGSVLGYWMSRRWMRGRLEEARQNQQAATAG